MTCLLLAVLISSTITGLALFAAAVLGALLLVFVTAAMRGRRPVRLVRRTVHAPAMPGHCRRRH